MSKVKPIRKLPSVKFLRECFIYNRRTGELRWKVRPREHFATKKGWAVWNSHYPGKIAGAITNTGHRLLGSGYLAHRLIFKMVTGKEPASIDHADGNPANNAWRNLRVATKTEQAWNSWLRVDNSSGYRGVNRHRNKWTARISIDGRLQYLGLFSTPEEASTAYESVARKLHGKFYRRDRCTK